MNLILCKPESFSLFMLIQFRKIMNLQPSWPSYQPHKQVYCLHSLGKICAQFQEKTAMHLSSYAWCNIHWSQSLTNFSFTLTQVAKDTWCCLHRFPSLMRSVHNSRKNQLYTYKACKSTLSHSTHCGSAHNTIYTYCTAYESRPSRFMHCVILHTILGKKDLSRPFCFMYCGT